MTWVVLLNLRYADIMVSISDSMVPCRAQSAGQAGYSIIVMLVM